MTRFKTFVFENILYLEMFIRNKDIRSKLENLWYNNSIKNTNLQIQLKS